MLQNDMIIERSKQDGRGISNNNENAHRPIGSEKVERISAQKKQALSCQGFPGSENIESVITPVNQYLFSERRTLAFFRSNDLLFWI
jgi:hypothetical protein